MLFMVLGILYTLVYSFILFCIYPFLWAESCSNILSAYVLGSLMTSMELNEILTKASDKQYFLV